MSSIYVPVRIEYGFDSSVKVGSEFSSLNCKKVLIISDKGIVNSGLLQKIKESLEASQVSYVIFDDVVPDPNEECVLKAKDVYIAENCDGILAVGGGSSIDTAKGAGIIITNNEPLMELTGMEKIKNPLPPFIAIPTTCGTGSEVTNVTVITDKHHFKVPFISKHLIPKIAILDPNLLLTLPPSLVASTGMDALTHAIEALTNNLENWYADACALKAIRMIGKAIRPATANGNPAALSDMLYASTLAGISFTLARLGLVHAMSHPISGLAGVPHGTANAVLLPYVMSFNLVGNPEAHALVARELGLNDMGDAVQTAQLSVEEVINMNHQLGIPKSFKDLGVDEKLIPQMIDDTFKSGNVAINARRVSRRDVENIYKAAFSGDSPHIFTRG